MTVDEMLESEDSIDIYNYAIAEITQPDLVTPTLITALPYTCPLALLAWMLQSCH